MEATMKFIETNAVGLVIGFWMTALIVLWSYAFYLYRRRQHEIQIRDRRRVELDDRAF